MAYSSILIGSNGYLGRHLALHLKESGFENCCYDIQDNAPAGIDVYDRLDISDRDGFSQLNPDVDFIFLFSGLTGTAEGFDHFSDFVALNEIGLLNLLEWMRESGCTARLVYPSTRLVYKGCEARLLKEDDPAEAKTIYAANKLNAERLLWMYHNAFDIKYTIFRICVPYGNLFGADFSYGTIGFFLGKARASCDISLYGDGQIRRTFTHVVDIVSLITQAIQSDETLNEVYNIGGENLSLLEAAGLIADQYHVGIQFSEWPEMAQRLESGSTVFDDAKLQAIIPYRYRHTLKAWLTWM